MTGIKRHYLKLIKEYLKYFPCVAILGPRQCGKTTILKEMGMKWKIFDLEKGSDFNYIENDPDLFFRLNQNFIAIDEAQLLPSLFKALRVSIDADRDKVGRFIITGSSSPDLMESISESLAGRIAIVELSPLTLSEIVKTKSNNFFSIFSNPKHFKSIISSLMNNSSLEFIHKYWFYGGYPEPWVKNDLRFYELWYSQYVRTFIDRDISKLFPLLNKNRFRQFIEFLAQLSGSIINYSEIARALGVSQPVIRDYFQIVHGTFIWRHIYPYEKNVNKRIVKHPKGYLRDSGILHHLLRLNDIDHLLTHPKMGYTWEAMVIEEILRGLNCQGIPYQYYYYRTQSGAEVDLVLEGKFGLIPIEVKYNQNIKKSNLRGIRDFIKEQNCSFGIVINNDEKIKYYDENLIGIPFSFII